jgi:hypothetical protein
MCPWDTHTPAETRLKKGYNSYKIGVLKLIVEK